jgi:hypothetical protein
MSRHDNPSRHRRCTRSTWSRSAEHCPSDLVLTMSTACRVTLPDASRRARPAGRKAMGAGRGVARIDQSRHARRHLCSTERLPCVRSSAGALKALDPSSSAATRATHGVKCSDPWAVRDASPYVPCSAVDEWVAGLAQERLIRCLPVLDRIIGRRGGLSSPSRRLTPRLRRSLSGCARLIVLPFASSEPQSHWSHPSGRVTSWESACVVP